MRTVNASQCNQIQTIRIGYRVAFHLADKDLALDFVHEIKTAWDNEDLEEAFRALSELATELENETNENVDVLAHRSAAELRAALLTFN